MKKVVVEKKVAQIGSFVLKKRTVLDVKNSKGGRPSLTDEIKEKVFEMVQNGHSYREISSSLGISIGSVSKILKN